ncbi:MAG: hypothetical protein IPP35_09990 [Elusimicrobia bacterium]|nr:hypothetical protein [Elusimicrobiota bacterium]
MKKIFGIAALLAAGVSLRAAVTSDSVSPVVGISTTNAMQTGIAIDARNNIHMCFYDPALQVLNYAFLQNGTNVWAVSTVSETGVQVAPQNALALENGLVPHVVFYEINPSSGVRHARLNGAYWVTDSVEDFVGTPPYVSIAVGTDNKPRVAYTYSPSSSTVYAEYSTTWSTYTVLASSFAGPVDLALTSANAPRILFVSSTATSGWTVGIADRQGPGFRSVLYGDENLPIDDGVALAVDALGNAHAVFTSSTTPPSGKITHYAVFNSTGDPLSGTPFTNPLDLFVSTQAPVFSDIAVDSQNHAAIVASPGKTDLRLLRFDGTATPGLTTLAVSTDPVGVGVSVALNPLGHIVTGYYQVGSADVRFATEADRHLSITGSLFDFTPAALSGASLSLSGPVLSSSVVSDAAGAYSFNELLKGLMMSLPPNPVTLSNRPSVKSSCGTPAPRTRISRAGR